MQPLSTFKDLTASASEVESSEAQTAKQLLATANERSPSLGDLILLAALPRVFDVPMLAELAHTGTDDEEFNEDVGWLLRSPFLHERAGDGWSVHDAVRRPLLQIWDSDPAYCDTHLADLESVHEARYQKARQAAAALAQTETLIRDTNPARYVALSDELQDRLVRVAVNLVHTGLRRSFDAGWRRMVNTFGEFTNDGLHHHAAMLVRGWQSATGLVAEEDQSALDQWGRYFLAMSAIYRNHNQEALDHLDAMGENGELDLRLVAWCHGARSLAMRGLNRFDEALASIQDEIALHEEYHADDPNMAKPWMVKADLLSLLGATHGQIEAAEAAVRRAEEVSDARHDLTNARICLARAHSATGDLGRSVDGALTALQGARLLIDDAPGNTVLQSNRAATAAAIDLLGPLSSRLLATLVEQRRQLTMTGGPDALFDLLLAQASALINGGDAAAAENVYAEARELVTERLAGRLWEIDAEEAQHADDLGNPWRGAELNLQILDDPFASADPWTRARCQTNAVESLLSSGQYDTALKFIERARESWVEMDHPRNVALLDIFHGDLLRRTGDLEGAEAMLRRAEIGDDTRYLGFLRECVARLARDRGRNQEAASAALSSFIVTSRTSYPISRVGRGLLATGYLTYARRLEEAAGVHAEVQGLLKKTQAFSSWRPTEESNQADEHAGRAVRILVSGLGPLEARARSAVEHLETAIEIDPSVGWYHLEMGWALTLINRPKGAARHFTEAARVTSEPTLRAALRSIAVIS